LSLLDTPKFSTCIFASVDKHAVELGVSEEELEEFVDGDLVDLVVGQLHQMVMFRAHHLTCNTG